jgi:hypothetical protein
MGKLVQQAIKTLYQGVSRQPDPVRLPGQVQEAENVLVSVVNGGVESRPSSRHISNMSSISASHKPAIYAYARDTAEQYMIVVNNNTIKVFDLDGVEKTVTTPNGVGYITGAERDDVSFVTLADYTVIANAQKTVAMTASTYTDPYKALINCRTTNNATSYSISITTGGSTSTIWSYSGNSISGTQVQSNINSNISLPSGFTHTVLDQTIVIQGNAEFTIAHAGSDPTYGPWSMTEVVSKREYLPLNAPTGYNIRVGANVDGEQFGYWAKFDPDEGGWVESADPYADNAFDATTMPHFLIRNANGTFTFKQGTYASRIAGDIETVPDPDFVGSKVTALFYHRNRLGFVSGETVFFSQSGKYFTFWPDFSTQSLDSDGFGLTVSSDTVNNLVHATAFRKSLFLTSDKAQFEVSGSEKLAPSTASVDRATTYLTEPKCRPITLGNTLYFAAQSGRDAIVFEYQYDDTSVSNVAQDITLHALSYVPAPIVRMTGDPTNDLIFVLSESEPNALYCYKMYMDGNTKAQSAWTKWTFGTGSVIKFMQIINGELFMVLTRNGATVFEKIFLRYELSNEKHPYQISMDRQVSLTGTYAAGTGLTTWTTPYPHQSAATVVLSTDFTTGLVGEVLNVSHPTTTTITAVGDFSGGAAIVGTTFTSRVILSKLYPRDPSSQQTTITTGRFQLKNMKFNFKDTGHFKVQVTADFRDAKTFQFTGRIVGSGANLIGVPAIAPLGSFRCPVMSRSDTVEIQILNDTEKPMNITSIDYTGLFNEITRAG